MKKILILITCMLLLVSWSFAAEYTVKKLDAKAEIGEDTWCQMTHTVTLHVPAPTAEFKIPVAAVAEDVTITGMTGEVLQEEDYVYVKLTPDEGFSGEALVTLSFRTRAEVTEQEDSQSFSLEILGGRWEQKVEQFTFKAAFPKETEMKPKFLGGYSQADVEDFLKKDVVEQEVSGAVMGGMGDHDSFTMTMDMPAEYFTVPKIASHSSAAQWLCGIFGLLLTAGAVVYWFLFLRSPRLHAQARTIAPEGMTPAELIYVLCGAKPDFSLLVLHWASLGYLTVTANSAGRVLLRKSMEMGSERREEERKLFSMLFANSDVCQAGRSRYHRVAEIAAKALKRSWNKRLFSRDSGSPLVLRVASVVVAALAMLNTMDLILPMGGARWLLLLTALVAGGACGAAVMGGYARLIIRDWYWVGAGGAAALLMFFLGRFGGGMYLMLPALALCIFTGVVTRHGGRRTDSGSDVVEQTKGFCRFLRRGENQHLIQMVQRDPQSYYSMLLYAEACGSGKTYAKRFAGQNIEECSFLSFAGKVPEGAEAGYLQFAWVRKQMKRNAG